MRRLAAVRGAGARGGGMWKLLARGGPRRGHAGTVNVTLTDAGCKPAKLTLPAGPTTFEVTNDGTPRSREFEVLQGSRILGEVENMAPGSEQELLAHAARGQLQDLLPRRQEHRGRRADGQGRALVPRATRARLRLRCRPTAASSRARRPSWCRARRRSRPPSRAGDVAKAKRLYARGAHPVRADRAGRRVVRLARPAHRRARRRRRQGRRGPASTRSSRRCGRAAAPGARRRTRRSSSPT